MIQVLRIRNNLDRNLSTKPTSDELNFLRDYLNLVKNPNFVDLFEQTIRLNQITLTLPPKIEKGETPRIFFMVFKNGEVIFNSLISQRGAVKAKDFSSPLIFNQDLSLTEDFVINFFHMFENGPPEKFISIQSHSGPPSLPWSYLSFQSFIIFVSLAFFSENPTIWSSKSHEFGSKRVSVPDGCEIYLDFEVIHKKVWIPLFFTRKMHYFFAWLLYSLFWRVCFCRNRLALHQKNALLIQFSFWMKMKNSPGNSRKSLRGRLHQSLLIRQMVQFWFRPVLSCVFLIFSRSTRS